MLIAMFSHGILICNYQICIISILRSDTETHKISLSHKYRDNICLPVSSPMADYNIELYEATSQDRGI